MRGGRIRPLIFLLLFAGFSVFFIHASDTSRSKAVSDVNASAHRQLIADKNDAANGKNNTPSATGGAANKDSGVVSDINASAHQQLIADKNRAASGENTTPVATDGAVDRASVEPGEKELGRVMESGKLCKVILDAYYGKSIVVNSTDKYEDYKTMALIVDVLKDPKIDEASRNTLQEYLQVRYPHIDDNDVLKASIAQVADVKGL